MLGAVVAPRSYGYATLPYDYYLLVALTVAGYFICVALEQSSLLVLARYKEYRNSTRAAPRPLAMGSPAALGFIFLGIFADRVWWWLSPMLILLLGLTTLSVFTQASNIAPFIYTLF
jgi:hypothetical protein